MTQVDVQGEALQELSLEEAQQIRGGNWLTDATGWIDQAAKDVNDWTNNVINAVASK